MGEVLDEYRARGSRSSPLGETDVEVFKLFGEVYPKAYESGGLTTRTKELMALGFGLLRNCDDCTTYHLIQIRDEGGTRREVHETLALVLIVGGSALIPSLRRAAFVWQELEEEAGASAPPAEPEAAVSRTPGNRQHSGASSRSASGNVRPLVRHDASEHDSTALPAAPSQRQSGKVASPTPSIGSGVMPEPSARTTKSPPAEKTT
jgi:AhpD family alkylhydroperoxidase